MITILLLLSMATGMGFLFIAAVLAWAAESARDTSALWAPVGAIGLAWLAFGVLGLLGVIA